MSNSARRQIETNGNLIISEHLRQSNYRPLQFRGDFLALWHGYKLNGGQRQSYTTWPRVQNTEISKMSCSPIGQCGVDFLGLPVLLRCESDSWPKLRKLGVRSDVGLGLSLCAVPLLQFGSQRSEEVGLECWSKVVARTVIKTSERQGGNILEASGMRGIRPKQAGGCRTR